MSVAVVDANLFIAATHDHPLSGKVPVVFGHYGEPCAPEQIVPEAANGLRRVVRRGLLEQRNAVAALHTLPDMIALVSMRDAGPEAFTMSARLDHGVYDCFYLVLAERLACPLVSGDRVFLRKAATIATVPLLDLYDLPGNLP